MTGDLLPLSNVLEHATALGIGPELFEDWQEDGSLPRPVKRRGLGKGQGSESLYDPSILARLALVKRFREEDRRTDVVLAKLYWEGELIEIEPTRKMFLRFLTLPDELRSSGSTDPFELGERLANQIQPNVSRYAMTRQLKRKLGKTPRLRTFLINIAAVAMGEPIYIDSASPVSSSEDDLENILHQGFLPNIEELPESVREPVQDFFQNAPDDICAASETRILRFSALEKSIRIAKERDFSDARNAAMIFSDFLSEFPDAFGVKALFATSEIKSRIFLAAALVHFRRSGYAAEIRAVTENMRTALSRKSDTIKQ